MPCHSGSDRLVNGSLANRPSSTPVEVLPRGPLSRARATKGLAAPAIALLELPMASESLYTALHAISLRCYSI
jgi:hypothetical protein